MKGDMLVEEEHDNSKETTPMIITEEKTPDGPSTAGSSSSSSGGGATFVNIPSSIMVNNIVSHQTELPLFLRTRDSPLWLKVVIFLFIFVMFILTIIFRKQLFSLMNLSLEFIQSLGVWGALLYILLYICATVFLFPPFLLSLAAGFLYGWLAVVIDTIGSIVGSSLAFLLGKSVFRKFVEEKIRQYPKFEVIDRIIHQKGFQVVLLLRLCPIFPDNILNYLLSVTKVDLIPFCAATLIGMLPGTFVLVYLGNSAKSLKDILEGKVVPSFTMELLTGIFTGVVLVGFFYYSIRVSTNVLNQIMAEEEERIQALNTNIDDPEDYIIVDPISPPDQMQGTLKKEDNDGTTVVTDIGKRVEASKHDDDDDDDDDGFDFQHHKFRESNTK